MEVVIKLMLVALGAAAGAIAYSMIERKEPVPELIIKRIANLLTVKSLVTIILTVMFAVMTYRGNLDQGFMTIYTMIVSFYFGTQYAKTGGGGQ